MIEDLVSSLGQFHMLPDMPAGEALPFIDLEQFFVSITANISTTALGADIEMAVIGHGTPLIS